MEANINPQNLELYTYKYNVWYEKEEPGDTITRGHKVE